MVLGEHARAGHSPYLARARACDGYCIFLTRVQEEVALKLGQLYSNRPKIGGVRLVGCGAEKTD